MIDVWDRRGSARQALRYLDLQCGCTLLLLPRQIPSGPLSALAVSVSFMFCSVLEGDVLK